jgi:hypothetical protein
MLNLFDRLFSDPLVLLMAILLLLLVASFFMAQITPA